MEPAVKPAVEKNNNSDKRVLVTATPLTIKEEKLKNLISRLDNDHIVDLLPLPGLVEFAENFEFNENDIISYLKYEFAGFDMRKYGTIVLGCTHFPLFKDIIRKLVDKETDIIDGSGGTAKNLKNRLYELTFLSEGEKDIKYYISGTEVKDEALLLKYSRLLEKMKRIDSEDNI
jgi:glutamate racemase